MIILVYSTKFKIFFYFYEIIIKYIYILFFSNIIYVINVDAKLIKMDLQLVLMLDLVFVS